MRPANPHLLIRADAGLHIGSGHVMRCLALAGTWRDAGGAVTFLSDCRSEALRARIVAEGFGIISLDAPHPDSRDLETTLEILRDLSAEWLILDGYHFDTHYQGAIRAMGCRLLVVDDNAHLSYYDADLMLNHSLSAFHMAYHTAPNTQRLLGLQYALLRPEFLAWQDWQRDIPNKARRVLVTLGGADPDNVTEKVVRALAHLNGHGLEARVVVGPANPYWPALSRAARDVDGDAQLLSAVEDMAALMAWAEVAVIAGGGTCWEALFMGLPMVVIVVADNQQDNADGLARANLAEVLGWHEAVSVDTIADALGELLTNQKRRQTLSAEGCAQVDGQGATRVVAAMMDITAYG